MNRKNITLSTGILIISLFSFSVFAEDVLDQAIKHAEGATRASDGKAAARHAADSKAQAEVAKKDEDEKNNKTAAKHIEDGIKSLDEVLKVEVMREKLTQREKPLQTRSIILSKQQKQNNLIYIF